MSQMNRSFLWPYDNNFTNYYFCIFWRKKYFISFGFFGRLFPNNHRNMFCRFHVSLINGFPLPKTRKMPDFRKSRPNQKGTKQAHTIKFTLLLTSNFLQNLSILRFFFTFWHAYRGLLKWILSMCSNFILFFFMKSFLIFCLLL